jgi:hypothetical protein
MTADEFAEIVGRAEADPSIALVPKTAGLREALHLTRRTNQAPRYHEALFDLIDRYDTHSLNIAGLTLGPEVRKYEGGPDWLEVGRWEGDAVVVGEQGQILVVEGHRRVHVQCILAQSGEQLLDALAEVVEFHRHRRSGERLSGLECSQRCARLAGLSEASNPYVGMLPVEEG